MIWKNLQYNFLRLQPTLNKLLDVREAGNKFNKYGKNVALLRRFKSAFSSGFVEVG